MPMAIIILQRLLIEAAIDIIYFPLWWYTAGIRYMLSKVGALFKAGNAFLAPGLWLKNLFVPMFGQYDWQGRVVSFFMRLVQIIFRTAALAVWLACCFLFFLLWLALPLLVFYGILYGV
jgi:hypothetical protein